MQPDQALFLLPCVTLGPFGETNWTSISPEASTHSLPDWALEQAILERDWGQRDFRSPGVSLSLALSLLSCSSPTVSVTS